MITVYLLLVVIPIITLWKAERISEKNEFLTKDDSIALRGIAAIAVIMAHYISWMVSTGDIGINKVLYFITSQLGGIDVLIFFYVSGYGNYESYMHCVPNIRYMYNRVVKLYIPYLLIKFILYGLEILFFNADFSCFRIISIVCVEDWFVQLILLEYFLFYLGWRYVSHHRFWTYQVIVNLVLSTVFVVSGLPERYYNSMWLFVVGMLCSQYKGKINQRIFHKNIYLNIFVLMLGIVGTGVLFVLFKGNIWSAVLKVFSGILLCLALTLILSVIKLNSPVVIWCGKRSLHLYIIHIALWYILPLENVIMKFWVALFLLVIITIVSYGLTEWSVHSIQEFMKCRRD